MKKTLSTLAMITLVSGALYAEPLLTGVIEDVESQTIEMPSLPGAWQRRIEWMAPEGSEVDVGDLVVRLDPGNLISEEEKARTDLEKQRFTAERAVDELKLEVMDAELALAQAESDVRMAELDAVIPVETIPRLDFERYQLTLATAQQTLARTRKELVNKRAELSDRQAQAKLELQQAETNYRRIESALAATEIKADKAGFVIYAENPFTGRKIFAGDTLFSGLAVASIANRADLQVRLWIHEADFLRFQPGQAMQIAADAQGIASFEAKISWRSSQAVEKQDWGDSGYFEALAIPINGLPDAIMPGMSVLGVRATTERQR
ncbi:MAG: hypothetical protein AAF270_13195 [Pseudomonadota bacterium]